MKRYSETSKCVKCGGVRASSEYKGIMLPSLTRGRGYENVEFIKRVCESCKHWWLEEALDHEE